MVNILLSGPAGAGKSQRARELLAEIEGLAVVVDFQAIYAAVTGDVRGPDGRYPLRQDQLLPLIEYLRKAAIRVAVAREIAVVATNSDGDPDRRAELLALLTTAAGVKAVERIVDPGRKVVEDRLSELLDDDDIPGNRRPGPRKPPVRRLSKECKKAVGRWYDRRARGGGGRRR